MAAESTSGLGKPVRKTQKEKPGSRRGEGKWGGGGEFFLERKKGTRLLLKFPV